MELSDHSEPAPHADAGADAVAPSRPPDRVNDAPARSFPWPSSIQAPPSPDAIDNARRGTWVMNDYLDGWTLMGANGRPVMRADGSRVAFWFRDIDRLAQEWAPTEGGAPPTTKRRPGLAALDSGFDSDWDPATGRSYRADVTKSARLLAYHFVQTTEPEEAVRRAVAMVLDDPVRVKEGNIDAFLPKRHDLAAAKAVADAMRTDLVGLEPMAERGRGATVAPNVERLGRSESDDIPGVYRAARDKLLRGRSTGGGTSIFDLMVDIEKGAIAGLRDGVQEAIKLLAETGNKINQSVLDEWGIDLTIDKDFKWPTLPDAPKPTTAGGEAAKSVAQFLVGFIPALKSIKFASGGAALTNAGKFAQAEGAAAVASATVLDPLEERLSNTWQELGLPQNILTDYLAANPDDSEAEGRLKNAIESLAIGSGLAGGLALSAGILRGARRAMTPKVSVNPVDTSNAAGENMASRSAGLYDPPAVPPRPLAADYPQGAPTDATGRLTHDIEGRPLVADYVAGRGVAGGLGKALSPTELATVAKGSGGARIEDVAPREIGQDAGRLVKTTDRRSGNTEYEIYLRRDLSDRDRPRVAAHEVGHLIDDLAGRIPTTDIKTELRQIYSTLNIGEARTRHLTGPQHRGYRGADVDRELMAEALRAYMTNPDYMKSVAPKTAARIRQFVNDNPKLRQVIQFNSLVGTGLVTETDAIPRGDTE